jgi:hypothetical protein
MVHNASLSRPASERPIMRNRSDRRSARALAPGATSTATPRWLRLLVCALALCVLALCALVALAGVAGAAPADPGADAPTATLDVVPDGNGIVIVSRARAGAATCAGSPDKLGHCAYVVTPGEEVTLTAAPNVEPPDVNPKTTFAGWSDARCPGTGPCTLRVDSDGQSVAALFSPQRVKVKSIGPGTVTTAAGGSCDSRQEGDETFLDCGRFPIMSQVTLQANPSEPEEPWEPPVVVTWEPSLCESPAPKKGDLLCTLSVYGPSEGKVGFDDEPGGDVSPTISVTFRVLKQGSGAGTVRSGSLDCGRQCALDGHFGDRETLLADAAPGSTFTGWRGVCSRAPRCSVAVGPVTAVVAVFDDSDAAKGGSHASGTDPGARPGPSRRNAAFVARLKRIVVTGHGRHRRVLMRLRVNAPATVRAVLRRGRHRVAGRRWRVRGGTPLLRLRVPARARSGRYQLALSVRDDAGHATRVKRRVRLPR